MRDHVARGRGPLNEVSAMPLPAALRRLEVELPACPRTLMEMMTLLGREDTSVSALAEVIEADMALAAAVVRTVNSAMFGLLRRVETVGEAVRYLGTREVAAITFETALRAAFTPTPAMDAVWLHASRAGLLMGRSARALGLDGLEAHTAGLFARSGQAVLLAHEPVRYQALLAGLGHDRDALVAAEVEAFGVSHAGYGSALCAAWGLAADVVHYVHDQVTPPAQWAGHERPLRRLLALGAVVDALLREDDLEVSAGQLAPAAGCTTDDLVSALKAPWSRLQEALA
jgi:HD-like signal output (HDOD) protein